MDKKRCDMNKTARNNFFVGIAFVLVLILSLVFIFAADYILRSGSGETNFTLAEDIPQLINVTLNLTGTGLQNATFLNITLPSGLSYAAYNGTSLGTGANFSYDSTNRVVSWFNSTTAGEHLINVSVNGTSFWINVTAATPGNYNITVAMYNRTSLINSTTMDVFVNDSSYPTGISTSSVVAGGNYSGSVVLNVSITEDLPSYVRFNITSSVGGVQSALLVASRQGTTSYWNATLNTASLTDGNYSLNVYVNDTKSGQGTNHPGDISLSNSSFWVRNFTLDNTAPTLTLTRSSTSTTSQIVINISLVDATSGIASTCTSNFGDEVTITGIGTSQVLTHTGVNCGVTKSYTISCLDRAGKSVSSTSSFATDDCSGTSGSGSSGSSGGTTASWSKTVKVTDEQFSSGYNAELKAKQRAKISVNGEDHHVGVLKIVDEKVTIEIASTPQQVELGVGEEKKVDLNSDGSYDLYVKLVSLENGIANLLIQDINEEVPEDASIDGSLGSPDQETPQTEGMKSVGSWWIVLIIVIVLVIIGATVGFKKRK